MPTGPGYTACAFPQPAWKIPKAVHFSGAFHMERSQPLTFPLCRGVCRVLLRLTAFMVTRSIIYYICGNCTTFLKKFCFCAICSEFSHKAVQKNQANLSEKSGFCTERKSPLCKGKLTLCPQGQRDRWSKLIIFLWHTLCTQGVDCTQPFPSSDEEGGLPKRPRRKERYTEPAFCTAFI